MRYRRKFPVHARRSARFATRALALAQGGPPWHRGLVAIANIAACLMLGLNSPAKGAILIAPAFGLFLTMSDVEGPLKRRLVMLCWASVGIAVGTVTSIALSASLPAFALVFLIYTFGAGLAAFAGPPFLQATRYAVVAGLLISYAHDSKMVDCVELTLGAAAIAALTRSTEAWLVPDHQRSPYFTPAQALARLRGAGPMLWRYGACYALAVATAWALGQGVDDIHPTWLAVSTLVSMWPEATRSYERALQRVFGTCVGALVALALLSLVTRPLALAVVAAALAFFLPHFVRRNFWLHSALMVVFILLALDASSGPGFTNHVVAERVADVVMGCLLAFAGTYLAFGPSRLRDVPS